MEYKYIYILYLLYINISIYTSRANYTSIYIYILYLYITNIEYMYGIYIYICMEYIIFKWAEPLLFIAQVRAPPMPPTGSLVRLRMGGALTIR